VPPPTVQLQPAHTAVMNDAVPTLAQPVSQPAAQYSVTPPPPPPAAAAAAFSHATVGLQPTTLATTTTVTAHNVNTATDSSTAQIASNTKTDKMTDSSTASNSTPFSQALIVNQIRTPKAYAGKTSWKIYKQYFERISKINKWTSNAEKFQNLSLALEAQAAEILVDIDESCDSAYQDAWDALAQRFGSVDDKREAMHRFDSRKQNTDESVAEFVAALKLAYHEAWPKADGKIKDDDLKRKFESGLRSTEMQHYLQLHARTDDFNETVHKARQFESLLQSSSTKKSVTINAIQTKSMQDRLTDIEHSLQSLTKQLAESGQRRRTNSENYRYVTEGEQKQFQSQRMAGRPQFPQFWPPRPPTPPGGNAQPAYRRRGCYTCGMRGCHSDRHANDQNATEILTTQPSQPTGCWVCGTPGCHSDRHATEQPTTPTTTQPTPPNPPSQPANQGNGQRSSYRGSRTPTNPNRPASR